MSPLTRAILSVLCFSSSFVSAAPRGGGHVHSRTNRCVVPSQYGRSNGAADDSTAVSDAFQRCSTNSVIVFEEGINYNIFQPIHATDLDNVEIQMKGNLHLPQNISAIQALVNATHSGNLYWFMLAGPRIDYVGTDNVTTGWVNSYGQAWWDANRPGGTGTPARPHLMSFNTTHGSLRHFKSRKPIAWGVQLVGDDIVVEDTIVDAYSTGGFPFNTDGFDVTGTNIHISNSVIYNGDDAIAIQSGSKNVVFEHATIGYQSHGMNVTVIDTIYAARFKSWMGGQGLAQNIQWKNIRIFNVTFPIFVTQSYFNQGSKQTQIGNGATTGRPNNSSVVMENFTWADFTGTINTYRPGDGSCASDPCWYDVGLPDLKHTEAIIIECNTEQSCKNFVTQNIQIIPQSMAASTTICINATAALNPDLGFDCRNGTFVPQ